MAASLVRPQSRRPTAKTLDFDCIGHCSSIAWARCAGIRGLPHRRLVLFDDLCRHLGARPNLLELRKLGLPRRPTSISPVSPVPGVAALPLASVATWLFT